MRTYTVYQVDAFTDTPFTGNPAGVVYPADGLTEREMQAIARELNNSETAFLSAPTTPDHDCVIRYFTPTAEVPICGHATVAAHTVRAIEDGISGGTTRQKTNVGILPVDTVQTDAGYHIVMTQGAIAFDDPFDDLTRNDILKALGLSAVDLLADCPVQVVSTGHSKVLIGVRDDAILSRVQPDTAALTRISGQIGCNGYFVFAFDTQHDDALTTGRMFAPAIGITEDPVTGNANGPLGAYLVRHGLVEHDGACFRFRSRQGQHMDEPGVIDVTVHIKDGEPATVQIGGQAVIVFKTQITLP